MMASPQLRRRARASWTGLLAAGLLLAGSSASVLAQRSVSGTIAAAPASAAPAAASAAAPAPAAMPSMAAMTAPAASVAQPAAAPAPGPLSATPPAADPAPAAIGNGQAMALPTTRPPPATLAPAASSTGSLMQTTLSLGFIVLLMLGLAWLFKRFGPKNFGGGNNTVKLVGALSVGARERILVVEVGEQWIVVGASPGRMNALATMPRQEADHMPPHQQPALPTANFAEWFKQTIEKRNGNNGK